MADDVTPKWMIWGGRVLSAIPVLGLAASATMKLSGKAELVDAFVNHFGFDAGVLLPIGLLELTCALLYAIPRTSVLGAILLTGYLGGAVVTHVRIGEGFVPAVILGLFVWGGLFLRDARIRALIPLRRPS